jgi:DNA repair exonuclease SbcCD ATPase subunit
VNDLVMHLEALVEAFARKIAALAIDVAEQKGRADRLERELDELRREYVPGYPPRAAPLAETLAAPTDLWKCSMCGRCTIGEAQDKAEINRLRAELAAEKKRTMELSTSVEDLIEQRQFDAEAHADTRAQLDKVRHDCDEMIRTFDEVEAQRDDEESAHAATKAKLGRAVAALDDVTRSGCSQCVGVDYCSRCVAARAILADTDSKDAGEAWRELLAAYASHNQRGEDGPCECDYCKAFAALAAVDARRGGGR